MYYSHQFYRDLQELKNNAQIHQQLSVKLIYKLLKIYRMKHPQDGGQLAYSVLVKLDLSIENRNHDKCYKILVQENNLYIS